MCSRVAVLRVFYIHAIVALREVDAAIFVGAETASTLTTPFFSAVVDEFFNELLNTRIDSFSASMCCCASC